MAESDSVSDLLLPESGAHPAIRALVAGSSPTAPVDQRAAVSAARQRRTEYRRLRLLGLPLPAVDSRDLARPLIEQALRDQRAQQMQNWQADATNALNTRTQDAPQLSRSDQKELLTALRDNAVALAMLEGHRLDWTASREAALAAVALEDGSAGRARDVRIPATPKPHLHAAYARFRLEGLTPGLLQEIDTARTRLPDSNGLSYWSAVYHLMAGEALAAHDAIKNHRSDPRIRQVIMPLLAPLDAPPHQGFPENFYSYAQNFADDWKLHTLGDKLDSFATLAATPPDKWPTDFRTVFDTALDVAVGNAASADPDPDLLDLDTFSEERLHTDRASDPRALAGSARARRTGNTIRNRVAKSQGEAHDYLNDWLSTHPGAVETFTNAVNLGNRVIGALQGWNLAEQQLRAGRPAKALNGLQDLQIKLTQYFNARYMEQCNLASTPAAAWSELVRVGTFLKGSDPHVATGLSKRSAAASLDELYNQDWTMPLVASYGYAPYDDASTMLNVILNNPPKVSEKLDLPLLVIGLVMAPLGIADCARRLRDTATAIRTYRQLLRLQLPGGVAPLCQIIEVPAVRIALSGALHERGDAEYRSGAPLTARSTYDEVQTLWTSTGSYLANVQSGAHGLATDVSSLLAGRQHPLAHQTPALTPDQQNTLASLGRDVPVDTIAVGAPEAAGADPSLAPHQGLLNWTLPTGSNDANPAIYGVLARAKARITQIDATLNYFGYPNGYAPVERLNTLLERAREFTEHAKNAERDYLNFLSQAEEQQYREVGAQQAVSLEKSSVAVEQGRVDQARLSATAAEAGTQLAQRTAEDAGSRVGNYQTFDNQMQDAENLQMIGVALSAMGDIASSAVSAGPLAAVGAVGGALHAAGSITSTIAQQQMAHSQRDLEKTNLQLAIGEADASLKVAHAQSAAAQQGVVVASLEHATALLRHDFAVQNLDYLRSGRLLNSDMWFRLAEAMRQLARTALDRAIETAFLAQQAYMYEADKDIAVIRFDYDASPEGAFLAADFLGRDLDALDSDRSQTLLARQQQVRFVVSLARDAPAALVDLQRDGQAVIPLPLRLLETRLPGLHNLRVGTLSVQPVALMDPLRLSAEVTHLGLGQVRRRAGTVRSNEASIGGWLPSLADRWPVAIQVTPAQTYVYTGLAAVDAGAAAPTTTLAQTNPFEGVAAASAWHLDLTAERNGIVDGSLADVLLTFVLTGMHDASLAAEIMGADVPPDARTQYLSAADTFPDAYYTFQRTGDLRCTVPADLLGPRARTARLRNVGFSAVPAADTSTFTALTSRTRARLLVRADGTVDWLDPVPKMTITLAGTTLHAELSEAVSVHWEFGDGEDAEGLTVDHVYQRQGAYEVTVTAMYPSGARQVWTADVVADPSDLALPPATAVPTVVGALAADGVTVTVSARLDGGVTGRWRLSGRPTTQGSTAEWTVLPGIYRLDAIAMRPLKATVSCDQRASSTAQLPAVGGLLCTNRIFDALGVEQSPANRNDLAAQLFSAGELTAADVWHLVVTPEDNPFLRTIDELGRPAMAWQAVSDVTLVLEHDDGSLIAGPAPVPTFGWEFLGCTAYTAHDTVTETPLSDLRPGERVWLVVRIANLGTATWTGGNLSFSIDRSGSSDHEGLAEASVKPGEVGSLQYWFTAPHESGPLRDTVSVFVPSGVSIGGGSFPIDYTVRTGLRASYYAGVAFDSLILEREDPAVDFDWSTDGLDEVGGEQFSVRWQGRLHPPSSGSYTFVTYSDDGVRLTLDGNVIINNWTDHGRTRDVSPAQSLDASRSYSVQLDYYQGAGPGTIQLCWMPPGVAEQIVPTQSFDPGGR